ncbi:proteasome subunit beta [Actinophytocola oryzae]|uniref:Proteasome subunit beta n=1 Tax=Actinophytocola oryzae TaxID=502181 RepID=A0A4V3FRU4_9PSEU|nr:proteasome subunit beta [Actinophytocola oryzae]TDV44901.1 proteasome beta subunit [Actinophytocola oryzae]
MEHTSNRAMPGASLPAAYMTAETSSFMDFLRVQAPHLLPSSGGLGTEEPVRARHVSDLMQQPAHGTTIVAVCFAGGVLIAGDHRATSGNLILQRDMEKVFVTDAYSAVGIAGTAGIALEMVRVYQVELSHYEKLEGVSLSLDAKTNKLSALVRGNLEAAMQGLAAIPLFVGYDVDADDPDRAGRIVSFDVVGGRYEERAGFHGVGSGSLFARSALKKLWDPGCDEETAIRIAIEALYDAADDDSATGGPDLARKIYPSIITVTAADGAAAVAEDRIATVTESVVTARGSRPRG